MDNPEFRRHVWLELTPHRLAAMPLLLGLLFAFVYLSVRAAGGQAAGATAGVALWTFGGLVLLWGTRLAADALGDEIRGRTWDGQRMSALSAWSMAWGKLVGGPVYPWYGAAFCAAAYLAGADLAVRVKLTNLLLLASLGVLLHAFALLATLLAVRKGRSVPSRNQGLLPLLAFFLVLPLLQVFMGETARTTALPWYVWSASLFAAALLSALAFATWTVVGVHRLTRAELQMRNAPWVFLGFLVFVMVYVAGFVPSDLLESLGETPFTPTRLFVAYGVGLAAVYLAAFAERKEPVVFRRLHLFRRLRQRERLLDELPLFLASLPVVALVALALVAQRGTGAAQKQVVAGLFLLLLRDLGLLLGLNFSRDPRRADLAALVYLVALYWLAPGLAASLGAEQARVLFWPRGDVAPLVALGPLALAAAGSALWARARWRRVAAAWPPEPDAPP